MWVGCPSPWRSVSWRHCLCRVEISSLHAFSVTHRPVRYSMSYTASLTGPESGRWWTHNGTIKHQKIRKKRRSYTSCGIWWLRWRVLNGSSQNVYMAMMACGNRATTGWPQKRKTWNTVLRVFSEQENSVNSQGVCATSGKNCNKQSIFSSSFKYLCKTAVDWVNRIIRISGSSDLLSKCRLK